MALANQRRELSSCSEIFICNLEPDAADSVRIEPINLDKVLILDVCRNACCLQPSAKEVRLFGLAERGDCFYEQLAGPNEKAAAGESDCKNMFDCLMKSNVRIATTGAWLERLVRTLMTRPSCKRHTTSVRDSWR